MNVGDYVRTKYGIAKIIGTEAQDLIINLDKAIMYDHADYIASCTHDEIIKSSPQIIDLIEVGDYVNGLKVQAVNNEIKGFGTVIFSKDSSIMEDYIYTIVTHEQMEAMQYRVEE